MTNGDLMARIVSYYPHFTKSEKKVADYVMSSPQEALKATITDLAENCGVGDTTVFRFCRSLKLNGYQDFRLALAISINSRDVSDIKDVDQVPNSKSIQDLCQNVMSAYISAVKDTYSMLNCESLSRAVDLIANASMIYFYGMGGSGITAEEAKNKFLKITPNVIYNTDSHMQLITASLLGPKNVAVIFSNSGITKDAIEIVRLAKLSGASTIFITKFSNTPAIEYTDVLLLCGANEGPMQGGSIAAKSSQMFIMDVLYAEYFRRFYNDSIENKEKTSEAIASKML